MKSEEKTTQTSQKSGMPDLLHFLYETDGPFAFLNRPVPTFSGQKAVALSMMVVAAMALVMSAICNLAYHKPETPDGSYVTYNFTSSSDTVTYTDTQGAVTYTAGNSSSKGKAKG